MILVILIVADFNTSYVVIKLTHNTNKTTFSVNFNTSYVVIKLLGIEYR